MVTEDPDQLPLPDIDILRMHWTLNRATALLAAAELERDGEDENDFADELEEDSEEDCFCDG